MTDRRRLATLAACAALLAACEEPDSEPVAEPLRAILPLTVERTALQEIRRLSGTIQPAETTLLAFPISGTVQTVEVVIGDAVAADEILVTLDEEPFALQVAAREAEVSEAEAVLNERREHLERQRELLAGDWVSEAVFDQAEAEYESARARFRVADRRLRLARRDLENTRLEAPFAGSISMRDVEPFQEVSAGQPLLELQDASQLEVDVLVPETLILGVALDAPVGVDVPALDITGLDGRVIEIGPRAAAANAFPVTVSIGRQEGIWPGMTAEVAFRFESSGRPDGFFIPPAAVLAVEQAEPTVDDGWTGMAVFRFDPETSTVQLTPVVVSDLHETQVMVTGGLEDGDVIAAAGVEFLNDGEEVVLAERPAGNE
jgi:membrane fusion protein, multidrug efflux system